MTQLNLAWLTLLSDAALLAVANKTALERGQTYANAGAVALDSPPPKPDAKEVNATVNGTHPYRAKIARAANGKLTGRCDCANAAAGWFCKHQVALGLVWRAHLEGHTLEIDESAQKKVAAASKRLVTAKSNEQALHDFLHAQDVPTLAKKLLEIANFDRSIARDLQQWRKITSTMKASKTGGGDLKALVTSILEAPRGFIDWRDCSAYAQRAMAVIPVLESARKSDPSAALKLALAALKRTWTVMLHADDSNGEIGGVCEEIGKEFVAALSAGDPQAAAFGDTYFKLQVEDPFGTFDSDAAEQAMGAAALAQYRKVLRASWTAANQSNAAKGDTRTSPWRISDESVSLRQLTSLHLHQLKKMEEHDEVLAVLRANAKQSYDHLITIQYLEEIGRHREALAQLEQLAKKYPEDDRVLDHLAKAYERDGCADEVFEIRLRQVRSDATSERFHAALRAADSAKRDVSALRETLWGEIAEHELERVKRPSRLAQLGYRLKTAEGTGAERDVTLRAEILCDEQRWIDALALVQPPHVAALAVLENIARNLPPAEQRASVELLLRVFDANMPHASNPYRAELALAAEIGQRMGASERAQWLDALRVQYRAKRNFIAGLPQN